MLTLAFDTCYGRCSVALGNAEEVLAYQVEDKINMQSRRLFDMIAVCLREAGAQGYHDIGRLVVTNGPGSFTGIRVGLAAALGLQMALQIPVATISTLAVVAQAVADVDTKCIVQLDAGRGQFYQQIFCQGDAVDEIAVRSAAQAEEIKRQKGYQVVGAGVIADITQLPDAQLLLKYTMKQKVVDTTIIKPLYVQLPTVHLPQ